MFRNFACRTAFAVGTALLMMPVLLAGPTPADAADKDKETSPAAKVKKQLDQPIALEITDQSLNAALNQIRDQTKINFVVDRFTIQQMGMDPEQMIVSVKLKDVKARSALRSVLAPYSLGYAIIGDTVLISTDDMAILRQMRQRINIDLEKVDLATAVKKLSKDTAVNLMLDTAAASKEAKTEVTLQMEDVPLETAVRLMAEMSGLKPVKVGNVLFITTKQKANEMRAEDPNQPNAGQPQPAMEGAPGLQPGAGPGLPVPPPLPGPGAGPAPMPPIAPGPGANPPVDIVAPTVPPAEKLDPEKRREVEQKTEKLEVPPKAEKPPL
jgi:hypothetical protein